MGFEVGQQSADPPGVLGRDDRHPTQGLDRPRGEITEIAERSRDDIQRGGHAG
jgi:hypothetical protein